VNKSPARHFANCARLRAFSFLVLSFLTVQEISARPDALEDCVERLAKKAAALPHERRMALVWTNHASLSEPQAERLRAAFAARMETAQVKWVQGEAAPALRVAIEQTPVQIVFTASVPGEGGASVVIEEVARAQAGSEETSAIRVRLEKQLLWQQESRVLSAAMLPSGAAGERRLVVLTEDALTVYVQEGGGLQTGRDEAGSWKRERSKALPGPRQPQRSARGQLLVSEESRDAAVILLPGRRCDASVTDDAAISCASVAVEWPAGRLLALPSCGTQTWWLKGDSGDFASEDRLLLRNSGAGKEVASVAELGVAGPVISIGGGETAAAAVVVVRNLSSGNYDVYRVAAVCGE
jgi:hypothetical protein